jgi:hypothetical protein
MRRAVVAVIVGGFAFGGIGTGLGQQPGILGEQPYRRRETRHNESALTPQWSQQSLLRPRRAKTRPAKASNKTGEKTIYDGYEISVPASWPVYWLKQGPESMRSLRPERRLRRHSRR